MPEPVIDIKRVSVTRGGVEILTDVNASIYAGEITAIIGPNGAGKTTLILAILGLISFEGTIQLFPERKKPRSKSRFHWPQRRLARS